MIKFHKVELSVSTVDELNKAMSQLPHEIGVVHVEFVPGHPPTAGATGGPPLPAAAA